MAVSAIAVFSIIVLLVLLVYAIWLYVVALQRKKFYDEYSYTRGANAWTDNSTVKLACDNDKEICVFRATQICTGNEYPYNYEIRESDPIASGADSSVTVGYGDFNPATTRDLTEELGEACNGQNTCSYLFQTSETPFPNGMQCRGNAQLLSTYTCIPKSATCANYLGK